MLLLLLSPWAPLASATTFYLMRHCARSTYLPDLYGGQEPAYLANYSDGGELPDWGVAPTLCTARGRRLIRGQGRSLRAEILARMGKSDTLKVTYDAGSTRDNTTAEDFLTGLGLGSIHRCGDATVFDPPDEWCPRLSAATKAKAVEQQLRTVPVPPRYHERIAALQKLLGKGVAPPMQDIPDTVSGGAVGWLGGSFVASSWIEAMLLQYGAGLPMAYGRVTPQELYELLPLHVYYRGVSDRGYAIERRGESNLLAHMLTDLHAPEGTSLYVGHDTNLDGIAVMLGLSWPHAPPYPANTTVPGGLLRLTATGDTVAAAFLYTTFATDAGDVTEVDVTMPNGQMSMPLAELSALADARIDKRCVRVELTRGGGGGILEEQ